MTLSLTREGQKAFALTMLLEEHQDGMVSNTVTDVLVRAILDVTTCPDLTQLNIALMITRKLETLGADFATEAPNWTLLEEPGKAAVGEDGIDYDEYATQLADAWRNRSHQLALELVHGAQS